MEIKVDIIKHSTNKIYAGIHHRDRKRIKDSYLWLTKTLFKSLEPVRGKVNLDFTFYFTSRTLDSSNCSFMAKMLEDCLVTYGVLEDDTIDFVGKFSTEAVKIKDKKIKDYCVIKIVDIDITNVM